LIQKGGFQISAHSQLYLGTLEWSASHWASWTAAPEESALNGIAERLNFTGKIVHL
jgi:hypothetical protein